MTMKLGVVMDPIQSVHYKKDSTLAMLWAAQARGWSLYYFEQKNLFLQDGIVYGDARRLNVFKDPQHWFALEAFETLPLSDLDAILMRKDPPFNAEYIYTTYLLELAEQSGTLIVNRARSLRDANEKLFTAYFKSCIPPMLVTASKEKLIAFWRTQGDIVCKPLDSMGGRLVFRLRADEVNAPVILDTLTQDETVSIMAQRFLPEIAQGDKRILLMNGEPIPYALARVPQANDWRGNLAVGAKGIVVPLTDRDRFICAELGPQLKARGLYFVGIDVIGDYLTEVNVTSPTGIQEIEAESGLPVSSLLMDVIQKHLIRNH